MIFHSSNDSGRILFLNIHFNIQLIDKLGYVWLGYNLDTYIYSYNL